MVPSGATATPSTSDVHDFAPFGQAAPGPTGAKAGIVAKFWTSPRSHASAGPGESKPSIPLNAAPPSQSRLMMCLLEGSRGSDQAGADPLIEHLSRHYSLQDDALSR